MKNGKSYYLCFCFWVLTKHVQVYIHPSPKIRTTKPIGKMAKTLKMFLGLVSAHVMWVWWYVIVLIHFGLSATTQQFSNNIPTGTMQARLLRAATLRLGEEDQDLVAALGPVFKTTCAKNKQKIISKWIWIWILVVINLREKSSLLWIMFSM